MLIRKGVRHSSIQINLPKLKEIEKWKNRTPNKRNKELEATTSKGELKVYEAKKDFDKCAANARKSKTAIDSEREAFELAKTKWASAKKGK